jgi:hypothetical protein
LEADEADADSGFWKRMKRMPTADFGSRWSGCCQRILEADEADRMDGHQRSPPLPKVPNLTICANIPSPLTISNCQLSIDN